MPDDPETVLEYRLRLMEARLSDHHKDLKPLRGLPGQVEEVKQGMEDLRSALVKAAITVAVSSIGFASTIVLVFAR